MSEFFDGKCGEVWYAGAPSVWVRFFQDATSSGGGNRCFESVYELWAEEILGESIGKKLVCIGVDTLGMEELGIFSCLSKRKEVVTAAVSVWQDNPKLLQAKELGAFWTGSVDSLGEILKELQFEASYRGKTMDETEDEPDCDSCPEEAADAIGGIPSSSARFAPMQSKYEAGTIREKPVPISGYPTLTEEELKALTGFSK